MTLDVSIDVPGNKPVERGFRYVLLFHFPIASARDSLWRNLQPAGTAVRITEAEMTALVHQIAAMQLPGQYVSTFSEATPQRLGPRPKGIPTADYLDSRKSPPGLTFRAGNVIDGWHRSRWLFVPWEKCSTEIFTKLTDIPENEELKQAFRLLAEHYEANTGRKP